MEEGHNDVESAEMHIEDNKVQVEKNKKRTVKTRAQIQALENFYNEFRYPTESMKMELAEAIGLTEKQISGWFCHRRLKEKKLLNIDGYIAARQDRSSVVIQDHGSGHRQDSCGSTKQGDDRNFDTREVESGRLTLPENSAVELTYGRGGCYSRNNNHMEDGSSGSSSSLRSMSNHHKENHFDMATSGYLTPKFPMDAHGAKHRSGPSGYLKLKRPLENPAVTAVKKQLGNLYEEDGPPLGVEFDSLPPGAFESMQDLDDETFRSGEAVPPASPDISRIHRHPKFGKASEFGGEYGSSMSKMDGTSFKMPQVSDVPDNYGPQKFKQSSLPGYYSWRSPEMSTRNLSGSDTRDDFGMRYRNGVEDMRVSPISNNGRQQLFGGKFRGEQESSFYKHGKSIRKSLQGECMESHSPNLSLKGFEYHRSADKMPAKQTAKDGKHHAERSMTNGNQASKRTWDGVPQLQPCMKKPAVAANQPATSRAIRPAAEMLGSLSEEDSDDGTAGTSSSMD